MNAPAACCLTSENATVISLFSLALSSISARNSSSNRSIYKSTRGLTPCKGFYGRWKLRLMSSCSGVIILQRSRRLNQYKSRLSYKWSVLQMEGDFAGLGLHKICHILNLFMTGFLKTATENSASVLQFPIWWTGRGTRRTHQEVLAPIVIPLQEGWVWVCAGRYEMGNHLRNVVKSCHHWDLPARNGSVGYDRGFLRPGKIYLVAVSQLKRGKSSIMLSGKH